MAQRVNAHESILMQLILLAVISVAVILQVHIYDRCLAWAADRARERHADVRLIAIACHRYRLF